MRHSEAAGGPTLVYVGVGSNIDPERNVLRALELLSEAFAIEAVSTFYRTAPIGAPGAPEFYNGVVAIGVDEPRANVSAVLDEIEGALGRSRDGDRFAPREIDLDLLLVNGRGAPPDRAHPDVATRAFVAVPLLELAPDLVLPDGRGALKRVASSFEDRPGEPLPEFTRTLRLAVRRWRDARGSR